MYFLWDLTYSLQFLILYKCFLRNSKFGSCVVKGFLFQSLKISNIVALFDTGTLRT